MQDSPSLPAPSTPASSDTPSAPASRREFLSGTGKAAAASVLAEVVLHVAVEGERDDISGIGQTKAALTLARNLPDAMKQYHLAKGAGHYGIFNGSKWRTRVAPVVEQWIAAHNG